MGKLLEMAEEGCGCSERCYMAIQLAREIELLWERIRELEKRDV